MIRSSVPAAQIWWLLAGFVVWSVAFVALYALQAVGCAYGWNLVPVGPIDLHRALLVGGFALFVALQLVTLLVVGRGQRREEPSGFLAETGKLAAWAALVATLLVYSPVLFASTCV